MLISPAWAEATGDYDPGAGDYFMSLLPLIIIFLIFYFLIIRPQQKRVREHMALVNNLRRGDKIVTGGGLVGKVTKVVDDEEVEVEIADGVKVRAMRRTITANLSKTTMYPDVKPKKSATKDDDSNADEAA